MAEVATGAVTGAMAEGLLGCFTVCFVGLIVGVLLMVGITDWHRRIIPNKLIVVLLILRLVGGCAVMGGLLDSAWFDALAFSELGLQALACVCVCAALLLLNEALARFTSTCGIGLGDIKLIFVLGMFIYPEYICWFLLLSSLCGVAHALISLIVTRDGTFPFGPSLILGFCGCVFL